MEIRLKEGFEDQIFDFLINHFTGNYYQADIVIDPVIGTTKPNPISKEQTAKELLEKYVADISAYQYIVKNKSEQTAPDFLIK